MIIKLKLPFPPSANASWKVTRRGQHCNVYASAEFKEYKSLVFHEVLRQRGRIITNTTGRWAVFVDFIYPKGKQAGDLDNRIKPLLDALCGPNGLIADDKQIDWIAVRRSHPVERSELGGAMVTLKRI